MASVIAFRARHCIIDLTGFDIPASQSQPGVTIPGIYDTIANLLDKNIIPIIKFRSTAYATIQSINPSFAFAQPLRITAEDFVTNTSSSPIG